MNRKTIGILVISLFCIGSMLNPAILTSFAAAQTYTLTVTVVDSATLNPIAGANVSAVGLETGQA